MDVSPSNPSSMDDTLVSFQSVVDGFAAVRATSADARLARMREVVSGYRGILADRSPSFNTLMALGLGPDEVTHSRILAWLMDPTAGHRMGRLFVLYFFQALGVCVCPPDDRYMVRREFAGLEAVVDICVCLPGDFVMYIEHKLLSGEGPNQVDREWRDLQRLGDASGVPPERRYAVFLTPDGRAPTSGDPSRWHRLSYGRLIRALNMAATAIEGEKVADLSSDWLDLLRQWSGD